MADITNPEAIAFCNEYIRPLAEQVRALKARIDAAGTRWFSGVNVAVGTSSADQIADGREAEGVSRLTAADVTNLMSQLLTIQAQLEQSGVAGIVEKPCVRPLNVQ